MKPDQIGDYRVPSDPRIYPDGIRAAFVVIRMDLEDDRYTRGASGCGTARWPTDHFGPR
jgi:hypothetical protein